MFANQSAELALNRPSKCLESVRGDTVDSRFITGSCTLHEPNELTVIRFHSELNELGVDGVLDHPSGPVGVLCTHPTDKYMLLSVAEENPTVNLWRVPEEVMDQTQDLDYNPEKDEPMNATTSATPSSYYDEAQESYPQYSLELVTTLPHDLDSHIVDLVWRKPVGLGNDDDDDDSNLVAIAGQVLSLDRAGQVTQWDIHTAQPVRTAPPPPEEHNKHILTPPRMAWDPHHAYSVAVTSGRTVRLMDWRTEGDTNTTHSMGMEEDGTGFNGVAATSSSSSLQKAHRYGVADLDYNPNKPYVLTTSGHDGLIKFWDLRNTSQPTALSTARGGHSHYAYNVQYNPFHDQLLVSTGTDAVVNLWRIGTHSSAPLIVDNSNAAGGRGQRQDMRVARHEHLESVYGMTWGAADAWIYATLGYDGKVMLHHVPSQEKYKILL